MLVLRISTMVVLASTLVVSAAMGGDPARQSRGYPRSEEGFLELGARVRGMHGRNLLARPSAQLYMSGRRMRGQLRQLVDGDVGWCGDKGRVFLDGTPTVLTYYLGEPKTITELGVISGNVDTRGNQDFEIRVADNSRHPGELPDFDKSPVYSTGSTLVGENGGGYHSWFARDDGEPLVTGKVDWIEFRIWRTYNIKAGEPAHNENATGATVCLELEVLGTKDDVVLPSAKELARRERLRAAPKEPEWIDGKSWEETLTANLESLFAWERLQDELALPEVGVDLDCWYSVGPLPVRSQLVRQIREATQIDLDAEYVGDDGTRYRWQKQEQWHDGHPVEIPNVGKGEVVFVCRGASFRYALDRNEFCLSVTADHATGTILPDRQRFTVRSPLEMTATTWEARLDAGPRQILLEVKGQAVGASRFWFLPQPGIERPGAGNVARRCSRREAIVRRAMGQFDTSSDRIRIDWEVKGRVWAEAGRGAKTPFVWLPGHASSYLRSRFTAALQGRLNELANGCAEREGIRAETIADHRPAIAAWSEKAKAASGKDLSVAELRAIYYGTAAVEELIDWTAQCRSLELAVADQAATFADGYPDAAEHNTSIRNLKQRIDAMWKRVVLGNVIAMEDIGQLADSMGETSRAILLANPLLRFEKLLVAEGGASFATNWGGANRIGNRIVAISPTDPTVPPTVIHEGPVSSMDLHWDGDRLLFSDGRRIYEVGTDGQGLREVTADDGLLRYDPCYLPDGNILFVSNACWQAVPCTGGPNVGNLHWIRPDGSGERRVTFDQDHNWNPTVMQDGRVLYSRWEYADTPHYFTRLLFRMNPDGSGQMEYYGSNSYWPNATYWPQPIPGHPTMISCIVSGHHGVSRSGEFLLLDPARGRHEADGAIQRIPGYGRRVEPTMKDQLVTDVWPKFAAPYPLAEPESHRGAGKYFLVCRQENAWSPWQVCLADVFDNIIPLNEGRYMSPIPIVQRPMPPVIPSRLDLDRKDAVVYLSDIYEGPGLKGFPRGSIKKLRVGTYHFRYFGNGDTRAASLEGAWDVKRILGTVPVHEDGSALFRIPANTPIFVQPVDDDGKAQQLMRSWFTAMPGEVLSCVGCHERQNNVPPSQYTTAANGRAVSNIEPWLGPVRGFSFEREIQPVLDRRCVGCHNGEPCEAASGETSLVDLRAKQVLDDLPPIDPSAKKSRQTSTGEYSPAYVALQRFVRRPGFESDYHMPKPAEYEADTSVLVQMLKKGHFGVQLTDEEWEQLYTWIDFNVPYPVNWAESHRPPNTDLVENRRKYKEAFADIDDQDEKPVPLPPVAAFEPPATQPTPPEPIALEGWPLTQKAAMALQQKAGPVATEIDLAGGVTIPLVLVPAGRFVMGSNVGAPNEWPENVVSIDRPFYMGSMEITNAQYACYETDHDSGVINERWKDRSRRGTAIDQPDAPVVRITWEQAMGFCQWLSDRTGLRCTLPTEAQWEWACRAGTSGPLNVDVYASQGKPFGNIADQDLAGWNHGRALAGYRDGLKFSSPGGRYPANSWGLFDMHGNVAEWCRTRYRPYPYDDRDGRNEVTSAGQRVVRGGSWNDTLPSVTSSARWRYESHKPVYNVGFRIVIEGEVARDSHGDEGLERRASRASKSLFD